MRKGGDEGWSVVVGGGCSAARRVFRVRRRAHAARGPPRRTLFPRSGAHLLYMYVAFSVPDCRG